MNRTRGFTIVELLVVIVVIAILAAISVVMYNGIQDRATNVASKSAASQAIKLVNTYIALNSQYPYTGLGYSCMLESPCYYGSSQPVRPEFRTNISTVGTLPSGVPTWSTTYGGVVYHYSATRTYNGQPNPMIVMYFLKGAQQDCGQPVANGTSNAMLTSSNKYTNSFTTTTICVVPIPGL